MNKKKILAIVLVVIVLLLGGASIYVATQLSTKQAVAPNAPTSKPAAADCTSFTTQTTCDEQTTPDCTWFPTCSKCANAGSVESTVCPSTWEDPTKAECTLTGVATAVQADCSVKYLCNTNTYTCQATSATFENTAPFVSCDSTATPKPDCATVLGTDTTNPNTGVCYSSQALCTSSCIAPVKVSIEGTKTAYKNVTSNTPGVYSLTTLMDTVSKSQIYVYSIELKNTSTATAAGVTIKDSLKDIASLTYMDTVSGCSYNTTDKEITCATTIKPAETKTFSFRVKAIDGIANGDVISNTAKVTYPGGSIDLKKDLAVSTVVSCNHTCTVDAECSNGLTCNTTTNKCRLATCATEEDCVCGVIAAVTKAPTAVKTATPTKVATAAATPSILPESGIFDLPGIAAFGGGLLLAVVGILLAL